MAAEVIAAYIAEIIPAAEIILAVEIVPVIPIDAHY